MGSTASRFAYVCQVCSSMPSTGERLPALSVGESTRTCFYLCQLVLVTLHGSLSKMRREQGMPVGMGSFHSHRGHKLGYMYGTPS